MSLRNLPEDKAALLKNLITCKPGQVSSMALTKGSDTTIMLLAFSEGEIVSEEEYFSDTLYYLVEGSVRVVFSDHSVPFARGEVLKVPAHVVHALESDEAFKVLQIMVP